jgi:PhzF family phenazine biosynthesis protein
MKLKIYQVDAFTSKVFGGNPAAICPLEEWLSDELMQNIAMENNLAETAFYVKKGNQYEIRWLTPTVEVDLCGHATLATAYVLFHYENHIGNEIIFFSPRSGRLEVKRTGNLLSLNFPTDTLNQVPITQALTAGFDQMPVEAWKGKTDYMLVFENEEQIANLKTDFALINQIKARGIIVTAKGKQVDFVSRFFGPQSGINEDPVTGSAHTTLTPYWSKKLGKQALTAIQLSPRKGYLECMYLGERVEISGEGKLYLIGEVYLD